LQDGGRFGYRKFGVPYSGAFDRESLLLVNALVGNAPDEAAIEMPLMGGAFVSTVAGTYACVGASCSVLVGARKVEGQCRFAVEAGETFQIIAEPGGVRRYLAAAGGFEYEPLLGSVSGITVSSGSTLTLRGPKALSPAKLAAPPESLGAQVLRFIASPQAELFDLGAFAEIDFDVDMRSDRKGVRLSTVFQAHETEIPSEPAVFGAIQIPPSGLPIILGPDGPTIGGYPKVGVVISADLSKVGQLGPGASIRFSEVSLEEATDAIQAEQLRLKRLVNTLQLSTQS
jgi:5-oxoprolinase (ATP-hydrolysing) subunit C